MYNSLLDTVYYTIARSRHFLTLRIQSIKTLFLHFLTQYKAGRKQLTRKTLTASTLAAEMSLFSVPASSTWSCERTHALPATMSPPIPEAGPCAQPRRTLSFQTTCVVWSGWTHKFSVFRLSAESRFAPRLCSTGYMVSDRRITWSGSRVASPAC